MLPEPLLRGKRSGTSSARGVLLFTCRVDRVFKDMTGWLVTIWFLVLGYCWLDPQVAWDLDWELMFSKSLGILKTGTEAKISYSQGRVLCNMSVAYSILIISGLRYLPKSVPTRLKLTNNTYIGRMPCLDMTLCRKSYCPINFAIFEHATVYSFQMAMARASRLEVSRGLPRQLPGRQRSNILIRSVTTG